mgnify:CR=1 FL=1
MYACNEAHSLLLRDIEGFDFKQPGIIDTTYQEGQPIAVVENPIGQVTNFDLFIILVYRYLSLGQSI